MTVREKYSTKRLYPIIDEIFGIKDAMKEAQKIAVASRELYEKGVEIGFNSEDFLLPTTMNFINTSKGCVNSCVSFMEENPKDFWIICDYYNGTGLSTIYATDLMEERHINGIVMPYNDQPVQLEIMRKFADALNVVLPRNFLPRSDKADMTFCFDIFEYNEDPIQFFKLQILSTFSKYMAESHFFKNFECGTFKEYLVPGTYARVEGRNYYRHFSKFLKANGLDIARRFFNGRPIIWEKI